jgi:protein tyrosine/serine phosphatase
MRIAAFVAAVVVLSVAGWLVRENQANRLVWDHFDEAAPGILYRSGQLQAHQLEAAITSLGLKTVVNFQLPGRPVERERELCRRLGIDFLNLPMPGDGSGQEAQFREVLAACEDPARRPVLVHCARGTCRTGAAVALYRFERNGWTVEDVAAEMRRQAYRDGWLPGYVFAMVKERPFDDLYRTPSPTDDAPQRP